MDILLNILLLIFSFILVIWGGNKFVDSSVILAKKLKISPAIIGATLVSVGTTLPELLVTILSSVKGQSGLAVGNALGSIVFNSCIIGGILLLFIKNKSSEKSTPLLLVCSSVIFGIMCINGKLELYESIILILLFCAFIYINIKNAKKSQAPSLCPTKEKINPALTKPPKTLSAILILIFSAALIAVGANSLINSASNLARIFGLSETIIGLTIIGMGTSLPELVTSIISIVKKESSLGLGNIIGSNIINLLLLIGISSAISSPLTLSFDIVGIGLPFALISTLLLCLPLIFSRPKKWQSPLLFIVFAIYYAFIIFV